MNARCIGQLLLFGPLLIVLAVLMWGLIYQCFVRDEYMDEFGDVTRTDWRAHGIVALIVVWFVGSLYLIA